MVFEDFFEWFVYIEVTFDLERIYYEHLWS